MPEGRNDARRACRTGMFGSLIIRDIAAKIVEIKGIDVAEVERVTTDNAKRLFGIKQRIVFPEDMHR